jgi:hypothetical protein
MGAGKQPDANLFAVVRNGTKPEDSALVRIGVAWKAREGDGYTLIIETIPTAWLGRSQRDVRIQLVPKGDRR